tara:strand:- start:5066 stop:6208 length:1143 start_codon:yes stop_codon:yes gene_type:complete
MPIKISVLRESRAEEQRVALVPDIAKKLHALGAQVRVQAGAGGLAGFSDEDYANAAVTIIDDGQALLQDTDIVLTVNPLEQSQLGVLKEKAVIIGYLNPYADYSRFKVFETRKFSAFSMELIPRISRAQSMDALSSQSSIAGYKSVLLAASLSGKFLPMLTTAAGTVRPSKVLIIGAGVAGLQAIATARRLGAIVEGYDVRAAAKDQVESLGAKFVDIDIKAEGTGGYARELTDAEREQQQAILARHIATADIVISTAAIPGRRSPNIISTAMVEGMKGGSVIVDLAAEGGGNCELTVAGETIIHSRVKIVGPVNISSTVPNHASELYARNLLNLLTLLINNEAIKIDLDDQIVNDSLISHAGEIRNTQILKNLHNIGND